MCIECIGCTGPDLHSMPALNSAFNASRASLRWTFHPTRQPSQPPVGSTLLKEIDP